MKWKLRRLKRTRMRTPKLPVRFPASSLLHSSYRRRGWNDEEADVSSSGSHGWELVLPELEAQDITAKDFS